MVLPHSVADYLKIAVLFGIYFIVAKVGLSFDAVSGFATLVWPPTGIALAALLLFGERLWPAIFLGAFVVNFSGGAPLLVALGIAIGNTIEAVWGFSLLRRFNFSSSFERLQDAVLLFFAVGFFSTALAATIGVLSLFLGGVAAPGNIAETWIAWWIGDMLGIFVITPFLLTWFTKPILPLTRQQRWEMLVALSVFTLIVILIFRDFFGLAPYDFPFREYVLLPPLFWIVLRGNKRLVSMAVLIMSLLAIWGTLHGMGPFIEETIHERLLSLQIFMGIVSSTAMMFTLLVVYRRKTEKALFEVNEQLRRSQERLQTIFDYLPIGVSIVRTPDGQDMMMNRRGMELLGIETLPDARIEYERPYTLIKEDGNKYPNEELPHFITMRTHTMATKRDIFIVRPDGSKLALFATSTPLYSATGKLEFIFSVFDDISKEKEFEKVRSEFVSLASHQLRTPATAINWYVERLLLGKAGETSPKQHEYLEEIRHINQRMISLVSALLNVSRIELGAFSIESFPVDIIGLIKRTIEELKSELRKRDIHLKEGYPEDELIMNLDEHLFRTVLQNILTNAIRYSPKNGEVGIKVEKVKKGQEVGEKNITEDSLLVAISDTGYGIPKSQQKKVFQKFFRADNIIKRNTDGTGLGLYMVKSIIEHMGGNIWFVSEEDKGTTFYITLPLS